jgi:transposase
MYNREMAYSQDIRERVVQAVEQGKRTQRQVAEDFGVSQSFVEEVWRRYRETGSCRIKVWRHGPAQVLAGKEDTIRKVVKAQPDANLDELKEQIGKETRREVSKSTMSRVMKRLGITRKKRVRTHRNATRRQ